MAPNGTSRATPNPSKPVKSEETPALDSLFDDLEGDREKQPKRDVDEEDKGTAPGVKKAGDWVADANGTKASSARSSPNPTGNGSTNTPPNTAGSKIKQPLNRAFPNNQPISEKAEILKCTHCKRSVARHAMPKHIEGCLSKKQEKQRKKKEAKDARDAAARKEKGGVNGAGAGGDSDDDEEEGADGKKVGAGSGTGSKKRKAGDDGDDVGGSAGAGPAKKKKKKDDGKAKLPRPKAPVDVEKQCGVELPQGGQCARSLTCKSHSMGAKRAVPGRSAPYDKLLLEYQRKNQAKLQKAQFDASAPNPDDESLPQGPVDSDEERDALMSSIARCWGGKPLYHTTLVPLAGKYRYQRVKGMLAGAFGGRGGGGGMLFGGQGGGGFFGTGGAGSAGGSGSAAAAAAPTVDEQGFVHARRGSVVPGARSMMAPAGSRKGSLAA